MTHKSIFIHQSADDAFERAKLLYLRSNKRGILHLLFASYSSLDRQFILVRSSDSVVTELFCHHIGD